MWTHDGTWHRLTTDTCEVSVLEDSDARFDLAVDVEVTTAGGRWSATFMTPEQIRDRFTSWAESGELRPETYFLVPDGVIVPELTLDAIEAAVTGALNDDGSMDLPFTSLDEDEEVRAVPVDLATVVRYYDFEDGDIKERVSVMRAFRDAARADAEAERLNSVARPNTRYFVSVFRQRHPL